MKFLYPSFLWALFFIAIPVLIHILNLRRHQTVYFSNVEFLKKVKRETKKHSKIKQLLILCCRILAISALVLAFARPYVQIGETEKRINQEVAAIYIDNSYSMNAESTEGKAIENAKSKAQLIVQSSRPDTRFALLTNELSQRQNRFYTAQEMNKLIGEVETGYQQAQLSTVVDRFSNMTGNFLVKNNLNFYLISDFQKVTSSPEKIKPDSTTTYNLIPININALSNLAIDSCWFETPAHYLLQQEELKVRVKNHSTESYRKVPVKFSINDSIKAMATVDLEAGESKEVILTYTNQKTGFQSGKIEISDYPIVYDNTLYLSYLVSDKIKSLIIMPVHSGSLRQRSLEALFINDNFIENDIESEERIQISKLNNYANIFLNELRSYPSGLIEALRQYVSHGGTLVFIPDNRGDINSYNQLLQSLQCNTISQSDTVSIPVSKIMYQHPIYKGVFKEENHNVDLPLIHSRFRFNSADTVFSTHLIEFADGTPALSVSGLDKGRVFVFSFQVSSERDRFTENLLFVPTLFNIVLTSSSQQEHYHTLEAGLPVQVNLSSDRQAQSPRMENLVNGSTIYPTVRKGEGNRISLFMENLPEAGHYRLILDEQIASILAFNYQLSESELEFYTPDEIKTELQKAGIKNINLVESQSAGFTQAIEELYNGKQFWRLFLLFTLLFLLAEAAIIRFWKGYRSFALHQN